ncbi:MAG: response regulator [Candidatus Berkelbacteria bacterium]
MLEGKVLLIVDDDLTLLEMYVERIKAEGAIVVSAGDGEAGLAQIVESKPSVILLDIMMPKMNGFDVLRKMQESPEMAAIPVILLTALNDDQKRNEGMKLGAVDYVVKSETLPIDVIAKINEVLENAEKKSNK